MRTRSDSRATVLICLIVKLLLSCLIAKQLNKITWEDGKIKLPPREDTWGNPTIQLLCRFLLALTSGLDAEVNTVYTPCIFGQLQFCLKKCTQLGSRHAKYALFKRVRNMRKTQFSQWAKVCKVYNSFHYTIHEHTVSSKSINFVLFKKLKKQNQTWVACGDEKMIKWMKSL